MHFESFLLLFLLAALSIEDVAAANKCASIAANDQLTECLAEEFSKEDAALNKAYNDLKVRLGDDEKELLKKAQLAWLSYRDKDCEFQALAVAGGQAYQPTYISCQTDKTLRRTKELKTSGW